MDFNTLTFLGFLALVTVLYYAVPKAAKPYFLLIASYAFYLYKPENAALVLLLIAATAVTWASALAIQKLESDWARRGFLLLALVVCLGSLFFYKYANFFAGIAADIGHLFGGSGTAAVFDLVAPLGLSYFTFQSLGYVIDVYLGQTDAEKNPLKYALFVSFFPCIFTGPIERKEHLMPQFEEPKAFDYNRVAGGVFRILWGYVKKMVIADNIGIFVKAVYSAPEGQSGPALLAASLLFSYQIYMDFSGCCDIAIGAGRMMGFELFENFNRPFAAKTYTELWNRWHMSLTNWFRDYIFFPLSLANRGLPGFWGKLQGWFNVFIIFPISGLWHGASWGYVVWGVLNGLFLVFGKATAKKRRKLAKKNPLYKNEHVKNGIQRCCVYLLFTACIVFFAADLYGGSAAAIYGGMLHGWGQLFTDFGGLAASFAALGLSGKLLLMLVPAGIVVGFVEARGAVADWIRSRPVALRWTLYYGLCLVLLFFGAFGQSAFIYQQY